MSQRRMQPNTLLQNNRDFGLPQISGNSKIQKSLHSEAVGQSHLRKDKGYVLHSKTAQAKAPSDV